MTSSFTLKSIWCMTFSLYHFLNTDCLHITVVCTSAQVSMSLNEPVIWATMWLYETKFQALMTTIPCFFRWQRSEGNNWVGPSPSKSNSANFCPRCFFSTFHCRFCFVFRSLVSFKALVFVYLHANALNLPLFLSLIKKKQVSYHLCIFLGPSFSLSLLSPLSNSLLI